jgi:hypothetical protein
LGREAKQEVTKQAQVFPDLCNKPIGLLLETEDYTKTDGSLGTRMVIAGIFQADTELTASEILDQKTKPEQLEKMVARLHHRPVKGAKPPPRSRREALQRLRRHGRRHPWATSDPLRHPRDCQR